MSKSHVTAVVLWAFDGHQNNCIKKETHVYWIQKDHLLSKAFASLLESRCMMWKQRADNIMALTVCFWRYLSISMPICPLTEILGDVALLHFLTVQQLCIQHPTYSILFWDLFSSDTCFPKSTFLFLPCHFIYLQSRCSTVGVSSE